MVAGDLRRILGSSSGDLTLRTTLNLELQRLAEGVIERRLEQEGAKKKVSQAALVALGKDGAVLALVGGRDYEASQFNRAIQAKRQAGSLFKLFVYLTALQRGYTPQSVVVDRPTQIGEWEPQNYSGGFRGSMTLRNAFAHSVNTIAVQLGDEVGIPAVIDTAKRMGVQSPLPAVPSLALGSAEVTLMEMTRRIRFGRGRGAVDRALFDPLDRAASSQQALYTKPNAGTEVSGQLGASRAMMLDLLQAVVNEGTGKAARIPNVPVGRQDRHHAGISRRLVHRVYAGNHRRGVGRKRRQHPDQQGHRRRSPRQYLARFCQPRASGHFQSRPRKWRGAIPMACAGGRRGRHRLASRLLMRAHAGRGRDRHRDAGDPRQEVSTGRNCRRRRSPRAARAGAVSETTRGGLRQRAGRRALSLQCGRAKFI